VNQILRWYAWVYAVICAVLVSNLEENGQLGVYREIELPASDVLAQMEITGIAMDASTLQIQFDELTTEVGQIANQAYEIIGHEVNLASPKQLQVVLFEELGMQGTKASSKQGIQQTLKRSAHFLSKLSTHFWSDYLRIAQH